jgi:hypothetical protein
MSRKRSKRYLEARRKKRNAKLLHWLDVDPHLLNDIPRYFKNHRGLQKIYRYHKDWLPDIYEPLYELDGLLKHYCPDLDLMPVDETMDEFVHCSCWNPNVWFHPNVQYEYATSTITSNIGVVCVGGP